MEIRLAKQEDFDQIKNLLKQLTTVGNPKIKQINLNILDNVYIILDKMKIIGCATLLIEDKIIHNGGKVGHIEDVVVDKNYRNKGIGKLLINHCLEVGKNVGCYKIILDCDEKNIPFYEKCNFKQHGVCMRFDII